MQVGCGCFNILRTSVAKVLYRSFDVILWNLVKDFGLHHLKQVTSQSKIFCDYW